MVTKLNGNSETEQKIKLLDIIKKTILLLPSRNLNEKIIKK